jgi:mono/diheme cytochrome c family protein
MRLASPLAQSLSFRRTSGIRTTWQTKTRRAMPSRFIAVALLALFAVGLAFGQAERGMKFEIPYEFTLGSKVLPAGTYNFYVDNVGLTVQPASGGKFHELIVSRLSGPAEFLQDGALVFEKMNDKRILSEVWIPGTDGLLVRKRLTDNPRDILLRSALSQTGTVPGRVAYNLTCARCHGQDGNGNEKADKFFNIAIPRLSSPAVQGKSDAELRELITQGIRAMPPVEIDESGFRHRLPKQDVDAVIAYVRTLKP